MSPFQHRIFEVRAASLCAAILLGSLGCNAGDDSFTELPEVQSSALVSPWVPSVVTTTFTSNRDELDGPVVEYGYSEEYGHEIVPTLVEEGRYEAVLLGLTADTEVFYKLTAAYGGEPIDTRGHSIWTGAWETPPPQVEVDAVGSGGFVVTRVLDEPYGAAVLDDLGEYVWWYANPAGDPSPIHRVVWLPDEQQVVIQMVVTSAGSTKFEVRRLSVDGTLIERISDHSGFVHDLVALPDGAVALLDADEREFEGETFVGDRLVEIAADGGETVVWSSWDHADPDLEDPPEEGKSFSGASALAYDEADELYHVSLSRLGVVLAVDRTSGQQMKVLGGPDTDVLLGDGSGDLFGEPCGVDGLPDGILAFDHDGEGTGRALEYAIDGTSAELVWERNGDAGVAWDGKGDVLRLPTGGTLISWGQAGQIEELAADGSVARTFTFELGTRTGYLDWVETLGPGD